MERLSQAVQVQKTFGTYERNQNIIRLYSLGVSIAEIARQFTVKGHKMSRQQVHAIVKRGNNEH
jgi:predicted DNA-binding protein YlxM (UPF0122 family)